MATKRRAAPSLEEEIRIEYEPLGELAEAAWEGNPKKHDFAQLRQSMDRFGYVLPVTRDDGTGRLVAGHGRVLDLTERKASGMGPPRRVKLRAADGEWLVPVIRGVRFSSREEAQAYLLADNRLVELGGWDDEALAPMLRAAREMGEEGLAGLGWSGEQLDELLNDLEGLTGTPNLLLPPPVLSEVPPPPEEDPPSSGAAPGGEDEAAAADDEDEFVEPPPPADVYMKLGQLWRLGRHFLLVGDSFNADDVTRLLEAGKATGAKPAAVITDPPYAIYGSSSGVTSDVADDKMIRPFFEGLFKTLHRTLPTFGHVYVFCDWRSWATLWHGAQAGKIAAHNMLVWDKGGAGLGSHYANTHELIFFGAKMPPMTAIAQARNKETGQRVVHRSNLLRFARARGQDRLHNAAKPRPLVGQLVQNSTDVGDCVVDYFCGSGTTLIASEDTGRTCLTMELNPANAQITKERWERMTGQAAELMP